MDRTKTKKFYIKIERKKKSEQKEDIKRENKKKIKLKVSVYRVL